MSQNVDLTEFQFSNFFRGARPQTLLRGVLQSNMPHWLISE